jgi:hypothetical protein
VPAIRSVLEYMKYAYFSEQYVVLMAFSFLLLFILFIVALEFSERDKINTPEIIFMVYALGFALEKVAALQEHGIKGVVIVNILLRISDFLSVYFTGTWVCNSLI